MTSKINCDTANTLSAKFIDPVVTHSVQKKLKLFNFSGKF